MTSVLTRPNVIARAIAALTGIVAVLLVISAFGGAKTFDLRLRMSNASGLRAGSQVLLGGISVGTVKSLSLGRGSAVVADLHLNPKQVHIGEGVSASVLAANLLGEDYVSLKPGDARRPVPSGTTLPESRTTTLTDLDQVVDVLNAPTRVDLQILLNETGIAVAGRQNDISAIVRQIPLSLTAATTLLSQVVNDNHTLGDFVQTSNQFIAQIDAKAPDVKAAIDAAAGAATTLAARATALRQTVIDAPRSLRTLQHFLAGVQTTAVELTPAAREISDAAPALRQLLTAVRPFTAAGVPTLNKAASVAPILTDLAVKAAPTVKLGVPTLAALEKTVTLAKPLSAWAGLSASDLLNVFSGWPGAIQFRDGISHIFNGTLILNPKIVTNLADQGATAAQRCQNLLDVLTPALLSAMGASTRAAADRRSGCSNGSSTPAPKHVTAVAPTRAPAAPGTTTTTAGSAPSAGSGSPSLGATLGGLLSGLLGGKKSSTGTSAGSAGSAGSAPGTSSPGLSGLLGYLLGR
jgi:phospholipid/cholesterol/gamma-HCH transport system substrate-binding protein